MLRLVVSLASGLLLAACSRDLGLPPVPAEPTFPLITGFSPTAAFSGDRVVVYAQNADLLGNQLIFPGGSTVLADAEGGVDVEVDGGLSFIVPEGLDTTGPLVLAGTLGRSQPSEAPFAPLGTGHPNKGTPVSQLRFRHNPVGLVDRTENVLMASSIFDLVVTDGKAFRRVPGLPLAMRRSPTAGRGLLSVRTASGGMLLEVDTANGAVLTQSAQSDTRELFILPPFDGATRARTVGIDPRGHTWLSQWTLQGATLVPSRQPLPFSEVLGAAALGGVVTVIGRGSTPQDSTPAVYTVTPFQVTRAWSPATGPACQTATGTGVECEAPDGPVAIVSPLIAGGAPSIVASLQSGDLLVLEGAPLTARTIKLISYAPIDALSAGLDPGKIVFTKAMDGALFQYDLFSEDVDWSVQLRGEPTVIDLAADIDEIAVGNRLDNAVDIITASTGGWVGRIAFNLGLGSAGGRSGGIVAPYSYDPALMEQPPSVSRMDLLMRNVGLVVSIDASSLEVLDHVVLEPGAGAPLRLLVTPQLQTMVVHEHRLGLLEMNATERFERLVTPQEIATPLDVLLLPTGEVVLSGRDTVRWYGWTPARVLEPGGELRLPTDAVLQGIASDGDQVLVVWRTSAGTFGGGFYRLDDFQGGVPHRALALGAELTEFLGVVPLRDGPAVLFDRQALGIGALRSGAPPIPSVISCHRPSGASPDGRFVVWLDEGSAEPMARLVRADEEALTGYSTYRLAGDAAGPGFDPSGQWFYLPVPLLDQLDVVQ